MWYSRIQRFISGVLIFSLLFSLTFRVSFEWLLNQVLADDTNNYNIVSIIVQSDLYNAWILSSDVKSEIDRYAEDIQKTLPMTKVVIIPTKSDEKVNNISSINEKLYFEWYKWINWLSWESKLIWSIFVWNIPLPVVYDWQNSQKSVFPYVDFQDKAYIYNVNSQKYEKNQNKKDELKAEIWHSFISPNTWDRWNDVKSLKDFFDKDHDYYSKKWNFSTDILKNTKPYVFYFDQIREEKSINYNNYLAYTNFLLNIEDISYNRFSKYLADKLAKAYNATNDSEIKSTISSLWLDIDLSSFSSTPNMTKAPDVSTIMVINKSIKRFVEIFNESSLSDMKNLVHNAWRYNPTWNTTSADMVPYLITQLDEISRVMVKNANTDLETEIDNLVKKGLSRNIAIPKDIKDTSHYLWNCNTYSSWWICTSYSYNNYCANTYTNIAFGKQIKDIEKAEDCTIYRGSNANSGTLVEANRWLNVSLLNSDVNSCKQKTSWYWAWNSPVNLNTASMSSWIMELGYHDFNKAIVPLFDIAWAKKIDDNSKTPSPLNCYNNNFIVTTKQSNDSENGCNLNLQVPINWQKATNWGWCSATNENYSYTKKFDDLFKENYDSCGHSYSDSLNCTNKNNCSYSEDWINWCFDNTKCTGVNCCFSDNDELNKVCIVKPKCVWLTCLDGTKSLRNWELPLKIEFKKIPSYIEHKSPWADDLKSQTKVMSTPNMPIDRDRYIDFIWASGQYDKINYPYLYRLSNVWSDLTESDIRKSLKEYLDKKSKEINDKIISNDPKSLTWKDEEIYKLLTTWTYPNKTVDLYKILESKASQEFAVDWDKKTMSYIDTLVFSLYWSKLNSPSAKYKFVFENYLSDQFGNSNIKFPLPGNKKMYEIAYIWADWDSKNMYVSMDPSGKAENPYSDIFAKNTALNNSLLSTNLAWKLEESDNFKCAPPEWVPLREWLPSVMCRLKTLVPPTIQINAGSCWGAYLSDDDKINLEACNKDSNRNWVNDCQEKINSVKLVREWTRISYNSAWKIEAKLLDEYWRIIWFDNVTDVSFNLVRLDIPRDENKDLSDSNSITVYDKYAHFWSKLNNSQVLEEIKKYVYFNSTKVRAKNWIATASFTSKDKEIDLFFEANVSIKDNRWFDSINLKSNYLNVWVKWDKLQLSTYNLTGENINWWASWVRASDKNNFFIIDWNKTNAWAAKSILSQASTSASKYIFELKNLDKKWKSQNIAYPLKVSIFKDGKEYKEPFIVAPLWTYYSNLASIKEAGTYKFEIIDNSWFKVTKEVEVLPDVPANLKLDMSTNISEMWGSLSNHLISIYDKFGNINSWELYNLNISIDWDFTFDDGKTEKTINTYEWFKAFKLKSPNSPDTSKIKVVLNDTINNIKLEKTQEIKAISKIKAELLIENKDNIKVWENTYKYSIKLTDDDWNLLSNFNSKAYLNIPKIYWKSLNDIIDIKNGTWNWSFITAKSASKVVNLTFNIEWLRNSIVEPITILPDRAIKIDLSLSNSKIEASESSTSNLSAELKDRYWNLVFNDNSTNLSLEILDDYKHVIKSTDIIKKANWGKSSFVLSATPIPWMAFVKVSSDPSLSSNSFSITGQAAFLKNEISNTIFKSEKWLTTIWDKFFYEYDSLHYRSKFNSIDLLKISNDYKLLSESNKNFIINLWTKTNSITTYGVWENAIKIDTYYFWNKNKIIDKKYNSLYTVLLWSEYGDITTRDYLASWMLFNKDNRSLAVTSLLSSNRDTQQKIFSISPKWKLSTMSTSDLSQNLSLNYNNSSRRLSFDLYNDTLSTNVGKIYFKWNDKIELSNCTENDISSCVNNTQNSKLSAKSLKSNYTFILEDDKLVLKDEFWNSVFSISKDFTIYNKAWFNISLDNWNKSDYLLLNLEDSYSEIVWNIAIKLVWFSTDLTRDQSLFENKINTLDNTVFVYLQSNSYWRKYDYTWNSTSWEKWIYIFYNDPFSDDKSVKTLWERETSSIANYSSKAWIWWEWENKSLLSFAAWENVWDATKYNQTISVINLWDPVISLSKIDSKLPGTSTSRNFDSSIWKMLWKWVKSYDVFDYNNDNIDDIIYLDSDNFIKLFEWTNTSEKYKNMWNLFYIKDINKKFPIIAWDFTNDWFDDIFFVNNDWKPVLLNNYKKHFSRFELEWQFALNWRINQVSWFDMNNDSKMDVTTLDENGDINIFLWWWNSQNPKFTKNHIDSWYWLKIDSSARNDNSAIYFNWMYQLWDDSQAEFLKTSEALNQNVKKFNSSVSSIWWTSGLISSWKTDFNENILNKLLFFQLNYDPEYTSEDLRQERDRDTIISNFDSISLVWDTSEIGKSVSNSKKEFSEFTSYLDSENPWKTTYETSWNSNKISTFLRSEYSDVEWINIKKYYTDKNWWFLKAWDQINVKVEITNTSNSITKNIAYLDSIPKPLTISDQTKYKLKIWKDYKNITPKNAPDWSSFSFMVDHFDLKSWETAVLEYNLETLAFDFWYIQTWLFEKWELWDDSFGDILIKKSKENCSQANVIYRSVESEKYQKWEQSPNCDASKSKLPEEVEKNSTDTDWNWVPDYIDKLSSSSSLKDWSLAKYAESSLNQINFDTDWDGLPDTYDMLSDFNEDSWDLLWSLSNFTESSMWALEWVEDLINWLGCWFGWAWCIASPLNAAPLAPWSSITLFWCPVAPAYPSEYKKAWSWIPIFSIPTSSIPFVWPPSSSSAWWMFDNSPYWDWVSQFRFFVTPTLTWWFWMAMCLWSNVASYWTNPLWVSPILPGWNCIVAAKKMNFCSNDWSDWNVWSIWYSQVSGANYSVINWNCSDSTGNTWKVPNINAKTVADYINYKRTGQLDPDLRNNVNNFFGTLQSNQRWNVSNGPFIDMWWSAWLNDWMDFSLDVDANSLKNWGSYSDILKIDMKRVFPFPDFLMEWWTRQIEEIVMKLTDWPTIYVYLPDFSWIIDSGWSELFSNIDKSYNKWLNESEAKNKITDAEVAKLKWDYENSCKTDATSISCIKLKQKINSKELSKWKSWGSQMSWIKQVFEFLWNLPMISIIPERIYVSVPWIDWVTADKALRNAKLTYAQRTSEISEKEKMWSAWYAWCWTDEECKKDYARANSMSVNANWLVHSLNQNIQALEEYQRLPERINKMLSIKEVRLEQILCNVETISYILGWRLWKNGKRFKAWVELYILVKSILKSWQLILDIFYDYDASCHDCKNERSDLVYCVFKIISMVIPKIPVIQFPKWPDIIVDLHNVRAWLEVTIPEFEFKARPIVLPNLPKLYLPGTPNGDLTLPSIPVLPLLDLPELPDLPSLPTVTLPDLPPPPKLPKLFAWIEWVLDILKLITKAMCILKMSPFVPEWRAWDQIAFLTERWGYLPMDFLSLSLPQFSYPFVDAIKVTSYVNLEFESDFITEFSRSMTMPLNTFTNNTVNLFKMSVPDLDFSSVAPENISVDARDIKWEKNSIKLDGQKLNYNNKEWINLYNFSLLIASKISKSISNLIENKDNTVTTWEFLVLINENLSRKSIIKDNSTQKIRDVWANVNNYNYAKEDKLVKDLQKNNDDKWNTLKSIINKEIDVTKKLKQKIKSWNLTISWENKLISSNISRFDAYNSSMSSFNDKTKKALIDLVTYEDTETKQLKSEWKTLISDVKKASNTITDRLALSDKSYNNALSEAKTKYLASTWTWASVSATSSASSWNSCTTGKTNTYNYKWLYILENNTSYRLFDYLDELTGDEKTKTIWTDESNKDLLYQVWDELFLKENKKSVSSNNFYTWNPIVFDIDDIKFYNNEEVYYPSINGFSENIVDSNNINVNFLQSSEDIANYRLEFYNIVDKFNNDDNSKSWNWLSTRRQIVDSFRDIEDVTKVSENENYITRKNLAYIDYYAPWNNVTLSTKELISIKDKLENNTLLNISEWTKVYAWWNDVDILYYTNDNPEEKKIVIKKHQNISFIWNIIIKWINWNAYLEWKNSKIYTWNEISSQIWLPILPGTKITWDSLTEASRITINYYDDTELDVLFRDINSYTLYDLGVYNEKYLIRTKLENEFYYSKISWFKNNIFSTFSAQEIMSPQIQADTKSPELDINSTIKVPVYIEKTIDLTESLYENSWIWNLKEVYIDSNLKIDSDNDWNPVNDRDSTSKSNIEIQLSKTSLKLKILAFDNIFTKNIRIYLVDGNNNVWFKDIVLNVYSPIPEIKWNWENNIFGNLNEEITKERVDLYRYRWWVLKRLTKKYLETNSTWAFDYSYDNSAWLVLKDTSNSGSVEIAKIDEITWKINNLSNKYTIKVIPANLSENSYTNIVISDWSNDLYYQYIVVPNVWEVRIVDSFDNLKDKWTYFRLTDKRNYSSFIIPQTAPYNPWDAAIYDVSDSNKTPIFVITKDWRVSVNKTGFKIKYDTFENRIVYKLIDSSGKEISRIMPISEWNFIMK